MVVQSMVNAFIVYSWARHYLPDVSLPTQLCRQSSFHNGHLGDRGKSVFMTVRESIYDCMGMNCLINVAYVRNFSSRRYLHYAFQHWSKQNRLSGNLIKSLMSHIDTEHSKVWISLNFLLLCKIILSYLVVCLNLITLSFGI